jgi:hypothetical protein
MQLPKRAAAERGSRPRRQLSHLAYHILPSAYRCHRALKVYQE